MEHAEYMAEERKKAIEKAKLLQYHETDRIKTFHVNLNFLKFDNFWYIALNVLPIPLLLDFNLKNFVVRVKLVHKSIYQIIVISNF